MSRDVASIIGSGTIPFTRAILPPSQRGTQPDGEGIRTGTQVMIGNPEDLLSVDAFAVSGVSVNSTPVLIFSKDLAKNILPRTRQIMIQNATGSSELAIGPTAQKALTEGFLIHSYTGNAPYEYLTLPFLDSVQIWAVAKSGGPIQVRMLLL